MSVWQKEHNQDVAIKFILFLISPFFAFLYSLLRIRTRSSYVVFFLFAVFFGLSFTTRPEHTMDSVRYIENFRGYVFYSLDNFVNEFRSFISFSEKEKDFYFNTVAFLVSRFTNNYHVLFAIFAAIFSYFSLKSFKFLTGSNNFRTSLLCLILAYMFMQNDIFNINGVRFWTAAWMATYVTFQLYINKHKEFWLLALLIPFVHAAYWIYLALLLIAYISIKFEKVWIFLFIISFFVSSLVFEIIGSVQQYLPPFLSIMIDSYTNEEYVAERAQVNSVIMHAFSIAGGLFRNLAILLFIRESKYFNKNNSIFYIYMFLLVLATFVNFTMIVPSLGGRYATLMYPFIAYIWLNSFGTNKYKYLLYLFPIVSFSHIYLKYHYYMSVLDSNFFYSSPFLLLYKYLA